MPGIVGFPRGQVHSEGGAHRWRRKIASGQARSITDLASRKV
jgi:hypothetical protein